MSAMKSHSTAPMCSDSQAQLTCLETRLDPGRAQLSPGGLSVISPVQLGPISTFLCFPPDSVVHPHWGWRLCDLDKKLFVCFFIIFILFYQAKAFTVTLSGILCQVLGLAGGAASPPVLLTYFHDGVERGCFQDVLFSIIQAPQGAQAAGSARWSQLQLCSACSMPDWRGIRKI